MGSENTQKGVGVCTGGLTDGRQLLWGACRRGFGGRQSADEDYAQRDKKIGGSGKEVYPEGKGRDTEKCI